MNKIDRSGQKRTNQEKGGTSLVTAFNIKLQNETLPKFTQKTFAIYISRTFFGALVAFSFFGSNFMPNYMAQILHTLRPL